MLVAAPDVYYIKDHYKGYSAVFVRLSRIEPDTLRDLLRGGVALDWEEGTAVGRVDGTPGRRS